MDPKGIEELIREAVREALRLFLREELVPILARSQAQVPATVPRLLTVREVAATCGGVNEKTVLAWIKSGGLSARRAGGRRYLVAPADLDRFLARGKQNDSLRSVDDQVSHIIDRITRRPNG